MKQNLKVNLVWLGLLVAGFALIQVLVAAGVLNLFYIQILEQIGINIILAVGLNLIVGFSGQFSLGHAGFMAIGPIGRSPLSVREDEIAAESVGINTTKVKVIAFVFGAITAAIAGSLQAGFIGSVVPKDYSFTNTINVLIIVVFGGLGSMSGTVLAAIVLGILNMVLQDFSSVRMIIYSLALILVMIFRPGGLLGTWEFSLKKLLSKKEAN